MRTLTARLNWVSILAVITFSATVRADEPKVYFEKECLELFSTQPTRIKTAENETKVEESKGMIRFEKVVVTETRDGQVVETYIQIRNCRSLEAPSSL